MIGHPLVSFFVAGRPIPKQSTRFVGGHAYTPRRVKDWQDAVTLEAFAAMVRQDQPLIVGELDVKLVFCMPDRRRADCENLAKAVLDAMNKVVYHDDSQIVHLDITRTEGDNPGVRVTVGIWWAQMVDV